MTATATQAAATQPTAQPNPLDALSVANAKANAIPTSSATVSQDSFLNLLVSQLRNQDPLQPVQNTEFITQLATMQSLQSQLDTGKSIKDLVSLQQSQLGLAGLSQAALLVGKNVTWTDKAGHAGAGTVQSVTVENGVMMINTEKGKVPVGALTSIAQGPAAGAGPTGSSDPSAPAITANPTGTTGTTTGTGSATGAAAGPGFSHG